MRPTRPSAPVQIAHFQNGDLGNLALITGAGILKTSDQTAQARDFIRFLLSKKAQAAAAKVANEYPVVPSASVPAYMTPTKEVLRMSLQFDVDRLTTWMRRWNYCARSAHCRTTFAPSGIRRTLVHTVSCCCFLTGD